MGNEQRFVAETSIRIHQLCEDLTIGPIDCFHGSFVTIPGNLDFVKAHRLNHASVVCCVKGFNR